MSTFTFEELAALPPWAQARIVATDDELEHARQQLRDVEDYTRRHLEHAAKVSRADGGDDEWTETQTQELPRIEE